METIVVNYKGQILIPKRLRDKYSIKLGMKVGFIEKDGALIIKLLHKEYFESMAGSLKGGGDLIGELMKEKEREIKRDERRYKA